MIEYLEVKVHDTCNLLSSDWTKKISNSNVCVCTSVYVYVYGKGERRKANMALKSNDFMSEDSMQNNLLSKVWLYLDVSNSIS